MAKDLIIRSSSAEFLIFERQTHDKGIQVRFEDGDLWLNVTYKVDFQKKRDLLYRFLLCLIV